MSDLIEKVARAHYSTFMGIKPENVIVDDDDRAAARAAIAAVAEWLTTQEHGAGAAVMLTWELKQLEQPKDAAGDGR